MANKGNPSWKKGGPSPNPTCRPKVRKDAAEPRQDGFVNALIGLGTTGRDKMLGGTWQASLVNDASAMEIWRASDMAARIVELVPDEEIRQGWELEIAEAEHSDDTDEQVTGTLEDLGLNEALRTARCYENAYGGGAILMGINDGQSLSRPLDLESVISFDYLTPLEPRELTPASYYEDPRAPKYGEVELWNLTAIASGFSSSGNSFPVHESRLILFKGSRVSRSNYTGRAGWGDSIFTRLVPVLSSFDNAWSASSALLTDFAQAVLSIDGLANAMAQGGDGVLRERLDAVNLGKSYINTVVIDKLDTFERKATPISGLPEMLDRFCNRLAAACGIPVTLLMGEAPAGLNATGDADIRAFYDRVRASQHRRLRPAIETAVKAMLGALKIQEPESWSVCFKPLWQPSEKEQAETRLLQSQIDEKYQTLGVLSSEEIRKARFSTDEFSYSTQIDVEDTASLDAEAQADADAAQAQLEMTLAAETSADAPPESAE